MVSGCWASSVEGLVSRWTVLGSRDKALLLTLVLRVIGRIFAILPRLLDLCRLPEIDYQSLRANTIGNTAATGLLLRIRIEFKTEVFCDA